MDYVLSDKQREMARHALGLPNTRKVSYRNHYCIAPGDDGYIEWQNLVSRGLAVMAVGGVNWAGNFFYLTLDGAKSVLLPEEHISPEDASKMI